MNIQQILQELSDSGLTDQQIGDRIEAAQSIVTRLRNGLHSSTSFERGQKIMALHKEVMKKKAA
jgi:hypothetical protein